MKNTSKQKNFFPKIFCNINNSISIDFMNRKLISTGLYVCSNFIKKYHFFIKKIFVNAFCIIHIQKNMGLKIVIINIIPETKTIINYKEKIVIIDILPIININWIESSILNKSKRGENCFGSTGI
ncbi:dUTP diphosphatase [Blattabacterium cuenoti]|uniref:dUTP diphosphatase n=1 Tax=Blattabacterium cuenoti TaxID=1653831 RepID=UPI001EEC38E3|nr:dUTP diphosphatase [Blattabacterium cuenoti]